MGERYAHLTWRERITIEMRIKDGRSKQEIADELGRHVSTIYREIKRGLGVQRTTELVDREVYLADLGQSRYEATFSGKGPELKIGHDHALANYLGREIAKGNRSPEAALGEIKKKGLAFETSISVRTLYRYIDLEIIPGVTNKDLPIKRNKTRRYHKVRKASRPCPGLSIEERPEYINDREEPGHWEGDSVVSKEGSDDRALVLTERVSRQYLMLKTASGAAEHVVAALDELERKLGPSFSEVFKSITVDNGSEFADCKGMEKSVDGDGRRTTIYYCHPYSSYEKGSIEKQNGMARRRLPKGTDFADVTEEELKATEAWINDYPRKMFDFQSSAEVFATIFPDAARLLFGLSKKS